MNFVRRRLYKYGSKYVSTFQRKSQLYKYTATICQRVLCAFRGCKYETRACENGHTTVGLDHLTFLTYSRRVQNYCVNGCAVDGVTSYQNPLCEAILINGRTLAFHEGMSGLIRSKQPRQGQLHKTVMPQSHK